MRMSGKHLQGLTLIELLMVLAVAAILVAAAVPAYLDLIARQRLKSAADTLYGHLQQARLLAVKENRPVTVTFQDSVQGGDWCYGLSGTGPCRCASGGGCPGITIHAGDFRGVELQNNFSRGQLTFTPLLGAGKAGTIVFSRGESSIRVIVSTLGRVRMCAVLVAGYPACPG